MTEAENLNLEAIVYLAAAAETVDDLRQLDALLRATLTYRSDAADVMSPEN